MNCCIRRYSIYSHDDDSSQCLPSACVFPGFLECLTGILYALRVGTSGLPLRPVLCICPWTDIPFWSTGLSENPCWRRLWSVLQFCCSCPLCHPPRQVSSMWSETVSLRCQSALLVSSVFGFTGVFGGAPTVQTFQKTLEVAQVQFLH